MAIMFHLQLSSTRYTLLQMCKKLLCLNPVARESAGEKPEGSHNAHPNNQSRTESEVTITLHL